MIASSRPVPAFVFGLIGGVLILIGGLVFSASSVFFLGFFAILSLIFGIVAILGSVMLYAAPQQHVAWGVIVLVFSVLSIVGFGGFIAGMVLGIVGGALGMAWSPYPRSYGTPYAAPEGTPMTIAPYGVPVMPWRMCMGCGRWIPWAYNQCPLCGTAAPVAAWVPKAWQPGEPSAVMGPSAAAAPPPAAPPPAPVASPPQPEAPPVKAPCPTCEGEAEWRPAQRRWYCPTEARFF